MSIHNPDRWVVVECTVIDGETTRKVLAGWYGGYGGSDCWKLSSGITEIKEDENYYEFTNVSGSVYKCLKTSYGMSGIMSENYDYWLSLCKSEGVGSIEIVEGFEPNDLR
jgi:hypothetical protein